MSNSDLFKGRAIFLASRTRLVLEKHSPQILLGVGIIGGIYAAVLASKATLKASTIVDELHIKLDLINDVDPDIKDYTEEDKTKDTAIVYTQAGLQFARLYGPAIAMGVLSIGAILASNGIMTKRQASLIAAYNVMANGFAAYRERVAKEVGEEKEKSIRYGFAE